jgi:hypothetical protein
MKYSWQGQTPVDPIKRSRNSLLLGGGLLFRRTQRVKFSEIIPSKSRRKSKFVLRSKIRRNCDAVTILRI